MERSWQSRKQPGCWSIDRSRPVKARYSSVQLRCCRWSEPGGERLTEADIGSLSYPGDIAVGPDQHGNGSRNRAGHRKLPHPIVFDIDQLDPIRPRRDIEAPGFG